MNMNAKRHPLRNFMLFLFVIAILAVLAFRDELSFSGSSESVGLTILVNPWNSIPDGYTPSLTSLSDGQQVDSRCYDDLMSMLSDCRLAGLSPYICSAYRDQATQQQLYDNKVQRLLNAGWDASTVYDEAARVVARPGTSEHQLGLACDIIDSGYTVLDQGQEQTATQQWLMSNSWRYGFILRYPNGKSDITGIIYEPWHYRYVGRETAKSIYESGLCLEEYLTENQTALAEWPRRLYNG